MSNSFALRLSLFIGLLASFALLLALPTQVAAQEVASLTGVVTDTTGAVVADVTVTLRDTKTNTAYETKTNAVGAYTFLKVLPGPGYQLSFTKEGFASQTIANIYVGVDA